MTAWRRTGRGRDRSCRSLPDQFSIDKSIPEEIFEHDVKWTVTILQKRFEFRREKKTSTFRLRMNCGTMLSLTRATTHPPHPAPVSLAPRAPLSRLAFTSSSNSGQLITGQGKIRNNYKAENRNYAHLGCHYKARGLRASPPDGHCVTKIITLKHFNLICPLLMLYIQDLFHLVCFSVKHIDTIGSHVVLSSD